MYKQNVSTLEEKGVDTSNDSKNETVPNRSFMEEKLKMSAARSSMTNKVKGWKQP